MSRPANAAGFLTHSAVNKARPGVDAACHTQSPHGMAWSAFGRHLKMLAQNAAYLYGDAQAVYRVLFFPNFIYASLTNRRISEVLYSRRKKAIGFVLL